jgi:hypothetical protein
MAHNERIAEAIIDLHTQSRPNIATTAKIYHVMGTTLSDRFKGKSRSIEVVNSDIRQRLTQTQEEALITYINKLNDRGFPPIPRILMNITESITHTILS